MVRDLNRLATEQFDAVVVGGGIYGLATAWELTARGAKTALVERGDFSAATSFNSLKTIHGGIRSLQHGAIGEMREFVRERRALARMAPHLVRVLPFIVPTSRHVIRNAAAMGAFLRAYDVLASDRNNGVDPSRALPASRIVSREECLRLNPLIEPDGVTGGAVWHDYQMHSPERFAMALLESATRAGAAAANYASARSLLRRGKDAAGIAVHDELTGADFDLRARVVVNAAGPWAWPLLERFGVVPAARPHLGMALAMNLVVRHPPPSHALGALSGNRFLFLVPWRDRSIIGTSQDRFEAGPDALGVQRTHFLALLKDADRAFPRASLDEGSVSLVHRGLLPAADTGSALLKRTILRDHRRDGVPGLVTVVGVRYTTARAAAERAADRILPLLGRAPGRSDTAQRPLAGGDIDDVERYTREQIALSDLDDDLVDRLVATYGTGSGAIATLMRQEPSLAVALGATCPVTQAEILHAVRAEMAVHLSDALRRTGAASLGHPGRDAVQSGAAVMAAELGWSDERRAAEEAAIDTAVFVP